MISIKNHNLGVEFMGKVGIQLYSARELTQRFFRNYSGSRENRL